MTIEEVWQKLDWEGGFEYFHGGSDFADVEDEEFHRLRKAFVAAWEELELYMEPYREDEEEDGEDEEE